MHTTYHHQPISYQLSAVARTKLIGDIINRERSKISSSDRRSICGAFSRPACGTNRTLSRGDLFAGELESDLSKAWHLSKYLESDRSGETRRTNIIFSSTLAWTKTNEAGLSYGTVRIRIFPLLSPFARFISLVRHKGRASVRLARSVNHI